MEARNIAQSNVKTNVREIDLTEDTITINKISARRPF